MHALVLVCGVVLAIGPDETRPSDADLKTYEAAKAQAKRDPAAHIRLALWCEAHGLPAQQLKHMAIALLADPQNVTARGLMGLVSYHNQWQKPEAIAVKVHGDAQLAAALAEYNARREKAKNNAEDQSALALWCDKNGLKAEAIAHMTAVTRLDPSCEGAWKFLGCKKHKSRWMNDAQIAADNAETEAQKNADRHWKPLFEKWRDWLGRKDRRSEAERLLLEVNDPRAVATVWSTLGHGTDDEQNHAIQVLGQVQSPMASRALALLATYSDSPAVRARAVETLAQRDPREFIGFLISQLCDPLKYEVRPVGGPGSPGVLFVEGQRYNYQWFYTAPVVDERMFDFLARGMGVHPGSSYELRESETSLSPGQIQALALNGGLVSPFGLAQARRQDVLNRGMALTRRAAQASQQNLEADVKSIESFNDRVAEANANALSALKHFAPADLGGDRHAWLAWWADQQGYVYDRPRQPKKLTITDVVFNSALPEILQGSPGLPHVACFGAGTSVRTMEGSRPIESLKVGDQILTQDAATGALRFEPIVQVFHNPPSATLNVKLGAETIIVTGIHRFWRAGKGWVMARDLKPGDSIRTLAGVRKVTEITPHEVRPVFNLQVASGQSFFVGEQGALVHDNTLVEPVEKPFDAEPDLAALGAN